MRADLRLTDPEMNRLRLLKAIRRAEPVARTQLSEITGLSGASITELTADFLRRDILIEERIALSGKGRPRQQLRLNPSGRRVIGASIFEDSTMSVTFANVRGDTVYARRARLKRTDNVDQIGGHVADVIEDVIRQSPVDRDAIDCVGVGLPAIVDSTRGVMEWLQTFEPKPVPLAAIIEQKLGLPVLLDSTFNAVARAEHWFGDGHVDDFCIVGIGLGIGFARYAAGALRVGGHGMNSEFGHMKLVMDGRPCSCGARGCLAAYCTTYSIMRRIREARGAPTLSLFEQLNEKLSGYVADARAGEEHARAVFQFAGKALGVALANHVNVSDPGRIIVLLDDPGLDLIKPDVEAAFDVNTLPGLRGKAKLEFRLFDPEAYSRGSAALALERLGRTSSELAAI